MKIFSAILIVVVIFVSGITVSAITEQDYIRVVYNNREIHFSQYPIMEQGRIYIPVRKACETFGMQVGWDAKTLGVTLKNDSLNVKMTLGSDKVMINGKVQTMSAKPFKIDAVTYVPLRFISETLGMKVQYFGEVNMVVISDM